MGIMNAPMMLAASSGDDVDFMVHGLIPLKFFGHKVWITTTHVTTLIVMVFIIVLALIARHAVLHGDEKPSGLQNFVEMIVEMLDNLVKGSMGRHWRPFVNYIGTIMVFIFFANTSGLFGLRPPTADYGVTLPLGVMTFAIIHFNKFKYQKVSGVIKGLCEPWPFWAPINIIGDVAVPISLSLRLFANVLSGTVMMALVYGLLKWFAVFWPAALHVYFDLFSGAIQTYVFCMLTMTYVADAIGDN